MIITPRRSLPQRLVNRLVHRFGIKPFPIAFENSLPEAGSGREHIFDAIYAKNYWDSPESGSGGGSELAATALYRDQLVDLIEQLSIRSMFDAPCGDLNWMVEVLARIEIEYIGGDIADAALASARARLPKSRIDHFDICADPYPEADLWHCRDTFFHLSFADIRRALDQAERSDIRFVALTTHRARMLRNLDIATGGFRLLDLERPPFNFPPAMRYLKDHASGEFPRFVGVWSMDSLRERKRD